MIVGDIMRIYLASPFWTQVDKDLINKIEYLAMEYNHELYSPSRDGIILNKDDMGKNSKKVFDENIRAIEWSDTVIVVIDGRDQGTIFECGVAWAKNKEIIGMSNQNFRMNVMLAESVNGFCNGLQELEDYFKGIKKGYKGEIQ